MYQKDRFHRRQARLAAHLPDGLNMKDIPNLSLPLPVSQFDKDPTLLGDDVSVTVIDTISANPNEWTFLPTNVVVIVHRKDEKKSFAYGVETIHPRSTRKFVVLCAFLAMCLADYGLPLLPTVAASSHQLLCLRYRSLEQRVAALKLRAPSSSLP